MSESADPSQGAIALEVPHHARRAQLSLSAMFLLLMALLFAAVSALARSDAVQRFSANLQLKQWERSNGLYAYHPLARDSGDYVLLRELPQADFSRGGVVYVGSSTLQHALMVWDLPRDQSPYVHNLAIESANMQEQFLWLRYLVEQKGLGSAGPGKTMVILGLSHLDTRDKLPGLRDSRFVVDLFNRYGLFDYDPGTGIAPKPIGHLERFFIEEKARDSGLLQQLSIDLRQEFLDRAWHGGKQQTQTDQAAMDLQMELMGGPGRWRSAIENQVGYLAKSLDYLRAHNIDVQAVILPMKSYNDQQPFARAFAEAVVRLCDARRVPLVDHSRLMTDAEFADGTHLNHAGQSRLSPILLAPALERVKALQPSRP